MKKVLLHITLCCIFLCSFQSVAFSELVGLQEFSVPRTNSEPHLYAYMWYPVAKKGNKIGILPVDFFMETEAEDGVPIIDKQYPLVILSHGLGSNMFSFSWLAKKLAESGCIVACIEHYTTSHYKAGPYDFARVWERTADVSTLLTALLDDPLWKSHIDTHRIGALGYSAGGNTALLLAGARLNLEAYANYVERNPLLPDSLVFTQSGYDVRTVNKARFEGPYTDPRIQSIVAVDPSHGQAYEPKSLEEITIPVTIISLGNPESLWLSEKTDRIQAVRPDFSYEYIDDALHISWLPECRKSYTLLKTLLIQCRKSRIPLLNWIGEDKMIQKILDFLIPEEREIKIRIIQWFIEKYKESLRNPLCNDGEYRTRAEIHAQGADLVSAAFWKKWKK